MDAYIYQRKSSRTLNGLDVRPSNEQIRLLNYALGLSGEAGEIAEMIKKFTFHGKPLDLPELIDEMGDAIWYISAICTLFDIDLGIVMARNVEKLEKRYPAGFELGGGNRE